jgi:methylmalonyl-CoA/ethylmalonyl-CoA epimerase
MPKLRHIALRTHDVEKTVAFYKEVFGLKQVGLGRIGVYLSDGYINLAVLKYQPSQTDAPVKLGVDHFGFIVEDIQEAITKLKQSGAKPLTDLERIKPTDPANPQSYYEIRFEGPDGQVFDISGTGWAGND